MNDAPTVSVMLPALGRMSSDELSVVHAVMVRSAADMDAERKYSLAQLWHEVAAAIYAELARRQVRRTFPYRAGDN